MQKGESGSWFGVLLSGTLTVKITDTILIPIPAGAIIGEMAMWHRGAERSATIVGGQPGLIATMLVDEIGSLNRVTNISINSINITRKWCC